MPALVMDPTPAAFEEMLAERERLGLDRRDEIWAGVRHVNPPPTHTHERLLIRLGYLLTPHADAARLELTGGIGIGVSKDDYRVPDLALHRPGAPERWHPTAVLALEIISPSDKTREKLPFYATHGVGEVVIVDPAAKTIGWLALSDDGYVPVDRSVVLDLTADELVRQLGW